MRQVILSGTQLSVSRISFGTSRLHHTPTSGGRQEILESAFAEGITHFDTSPYYGFGLAELEIGKFLRTHSGKVTVASKFGLYPPLGAGGGYFRVSARKIAGRLVPSLSRPRVDWSIRSAEASLEASLRRIGVERLDLLLLHDPHPQSVDASAVLAWLQQVKSQGRILEWGVAGEAGEFSRWLQDRSPLCRVTQVRDTPEGCQADPVTAAGLPLHLTFGALADIRGPEATPELIRSRLAGALRRNAAGSLLVSTRSTGHVREIAAAARSADDATA